MVRLGRALKAMQVVVYKLDVSGQWKPIKVFDSKYGNNKSNASERFTSQCEAGRTTARKRMESDALAND